MSLKDKAGYNLNLHGLRGLSAFWIFLTHVYLGSHEWGFYPHESWPRVVAWLLESGRYAVDLFFMISGYLITESLTRKADARRFLVDRAIRIYPAFLAALAPLAIVGMLLQQRMFAEVPPQEWPLMLLANLLLLPGAVDMEPILGVAWTLSFEMVFYLTAAGVFVLARRQQRELGVSLAACAGLILFPHYSGVAAFYVGAFVYLYRDTALQWLNRLHAPLLVLILILVLWQGMFVPDYHRANVGLTPFFSLLGIVGFVLQLSFFNSVVAGAGWVSRMLRSRFMQFMGTISYSFYLWHTHVMYVIKRLTMKYVVPVYGDVAGTLCFGIVSLVAALILGYLSYRVFEVAAGRFLRGRYLKAPVVVAQPSAA